MGCSQSRVDKEEAVQRCKERKQHMKSSVVARNAFAAAHSSYAVALKNTGLALSDYAPGESSHKQEPSPSVSQPPMENLVRPPPIPDFDNSGTIPRAASMPENMIPTPEPFRSADAIMEEDEGDPDGNSFMRRKPKSSVRFSTTAVAATDDEDDDVHRVRSMTPPHPHQSMHPSPVHGETWSYLFNVEDMPRPSLADVEDDDREMAGRKSTGDGSKRVLPRADADNAKETIDNTTEPSSSPSTSGPTRPPQVMIKRGRSTVRGNFTIALITIFNDLDDHFLKSSECAQEVSKMLEANRLHYHSNFADNRGHIDHSARLMKVITWNKSFRYLRNEDGQSPDMDLEEHETHATVLDKLLAWEKKLYDEVKAGELMKIEYQKKVALLNKQKRRGTNSEALERTKAAVSHLHTRYIVDMQSLDSTVTEINRLRDKQLYPKLVALVDGMGRMWDGMREHHEQQRKVATAVLRFAEVVEGPRETTGHHHERTIQLWVVIQEWSSQFEKMMTHQKEYVRSLNAWLRLNLVPIESSMKEKVVLSPPRPQSSPVHALMLAWHDRLDKVSEESARSAIFNFVATVHAIVQHQEDEIKSRLRCEASRKELDHRTRQFSEWRARHAPDADDDDGAVAERRVALEVIKDRLEEEEENHAEKCANVRNKSLVNLKACLPELFSGLTEFARTCSEMYRDLLRPPPVTRGGQS